MLLNSYYLFSVLFNRDKQIHTTNWGSAIPRRSTGLKKGGQSLQLGSAGFSLAILPFALVNIRLENVSQDLWFEGWFELEEEVVQGGLGWVGWVAGETWKPQSASAINTNTTSLSNDFKRKIRRKAQFDVLNS